MMTMAVLKQMVVDVANRFIRILNWCCNGTTIMCTAMVHVHLINFQLLKPFLLSKNIGYNQYSTHTLDLQRNIEI